MAPGRAAASASAVVAEGSPESLEVRVAGCGEPLEVEPGLTEFICPDCAMPQSLPPELMPPPPPRRKALPLPRAAADVRGARLPCGALLSVPVGLARCACPICGAELAVDPTWLRHYLLSSAAVEGALPVVPIGTSSSPPILQVREEHEEHPNIVSRTGLIRAEPNNPLNRMEHGHTKRPNQLIPEQGEPYHSDYMTDGEGINEANEIITRHHKQTNRESVGRGIISAEKTQARPLNQFRHQAHDQHSSYAFRMKQTHLDYRDRVNEVQADSVDPTVFRESGCIALIDETPATRINCITLHSVGPKPINVDNNQAQAQNPKRIIQRAQKQPSLIAISQENAQDKHADGVIHVQEKQRRTANQANHRQEACAQLDNQTVAGDSSRRVRCSEKDQSEPFSCTIRKRKTMSLLANSNSGLELRRSKHLAKDSPAAKDKEHGKKKVYGQQVSQNDQVSAAVMDTESIHTDPVERQAASSTGHMPAAITYSEPSESEPDDLYVPSPDQSLSSSPDIDRIINNICPSSSPRHEIPEKGSNEFDNIELTTPPPPSHIDMSDPESFACNYVPREVRKALAKLRSSTSLFERAMSQESSGDVHALTDSEDCNKPWNVGTKRNQGRGRGLTLCLKVWTLPKGVRIPVLLNASGEPVGKEAGTLSSFLGALARDGILAPLRHQDWRRVPEKNKDVMYHIVKLKFDIAPAAELWIVKCIGRKWKSWKALLKQKHYDTHRTVEERLGDQNPRVLKEQWQYLVAYWGTEKAKAASSRNKACRANVTATHTAGTKSFARIIEEEKQKRPNNEELTPADLFLLTHIHKNGKPMKKEKADIIARVCEQSHKQAKCSGSDSTANKVGLESCSIGLRGKRDRRRKAVLQASFKEAEEAKRKAEDEAAMLRKKMMAMEESQKKLQEDLANMKNKDVMWHIIKLTFDVAPSSESVLLKCLRTKWRNWRCNLKRKHYDSHITEEEHLADCDPRVLKEQWRFLVAYWNTKEAQAASARCKASRAKSTYINSTGSNSFAWILDEESCSRDKARKRSDDVTAMGEKRRGRMHNHEPGACPSGLKEKAALKASFKEAVDAKEIAENEVATLRRR